MGRGAVERRPPVSVWSSDIADLPEIGGRQDLETARVCLKHALTTLTAAGDLARMWEEYATFLIDFADGNTTIALESLQAFRVGFEALEADADTGDLLVASAKMATSAFIVGTANPYLTFYSERDEIFDDVHPLAHKALALAWSADATDPFDPVIRIDEERPKRLEQALEKNWMRDILDRAVTGSANG